MDLNSVSLLTPTKAIDTQNAKAYRARVDGNKKRALSSDTPLHCRNGSATTTASSRPRGRASKPKRQPAGCANRSYSEPPPAMVSPAVEGEHRSGGAQSRVRDGSHNRARQGKQNSRDRDKETPDGDMSESSISADEGGRRNRPAEFGRSHNTSSLPGSTLEPSSQKSSLVSFVVVDVIHTCLTNVSGHCSVRR